MSAATEDLNTASRSPDLANYNLAAGAHIFALTLVCVNTSGLAVAGADTANYTFVGIATSEQDNTDGSANDLDVDVARTGCYKLTGSGFAATDVGKPVFLIDDSTVGLVGNADVDNYIRVGRITEYVDSTHVWVEIEPGHKAGDVAEAFGKARMYAVEATGVNAAAFDLSTQAAFWGGSDFYIDRVLAVRSTVTATGADSTVARKIVTTHWTLASGVLSAVGDETANTWLITFIGKLY